MAFVIFCDRSREIGLEITGADGLSQIVQDWCARVLADSRVRGNVALAVQDFVVEMMKQGIYVCRADDYEGKEAVARILCVPRPDEPVWKGVAISIQQVIRALVDMGPDVEMSIEVLEIDYSEPVKDRRMRVVGVIPCKSGALLAAFEQFALNVIPAPGWPGSWRHVNVDVKSSLFVEMIWPREPGGQIEVAWWGSLILRRPRTSATSHIRLKGPGGEDWPPRRRTKRPRPVGPRAGLPKLPA